MKNLFILILSFFALSLTAQTANYTTTARAELDVLSVHDKTLAYSFYDTLSGSNDTLIISFPSAFPVDYTATLGSTWVSTGTTTDSDVFLQGRNASHETWTDLGTTTFAAETTTAYSDGIAVGGYLYYRLVFVSASGNAHLKNTLVLKKKVGSSSSAATASYLVYTALLSQSGTDAPVATVLENTLGGTVVWSYVSGGLDQATLSGAFPAGRTVVMPPLGMNASASGALLYASRASDNVIEIYDDAELSYENVLFEIRVYP